MRRVLCIVPTVMLLLSPLRGVAEGKSYEEYFSRARSLYDSGKYSEAEVEFANAKRCAGEERFLMQQTDYYMVMCRSKTGDATEELRVFLANYPVSMFNDEVEFALAGELFESGNYDEALGYYMASDFKRIAPEDRDEYYFKCGYSIFSSGDFRKASEMLSKVDKRGKYAAHALYCMAYMEYSEGDYSSAKEKFLNLTDDAAYAEVVPFYLLHIEFLEGNYQYVVENADRVLSVAEGGRRVDITRMVGESWFKMEDWQKSADFMNQYESMGGTMGREENYLRGCSEYMTGEYAAAENYLIKVCGTDDKLTQNAAYHLADCYVRSGQKEKAMQSFAMASTRGLDETISEDALYNYCKLQYELGGGYFNESINQLNRYLTLYPSSEHAAQVKEYLVAAYYNSHNFGAAYDLITKMRNPDNNIKTALQRITYFRALEYYNQGDYDRSLNLLNEAARYDYNAKYTALTSFWQGEVMYRSGDYSSAVSKFENYIRLSPKTEPENLMARYNAAYAYFNMADTAQSRKWFENFLDSYPSRDSYRADAYNRLGDIDASERAFWRAIEKYDGAIKIGTDEKYYATFRRAVMLGLVDRGERKIETLNEIISKGDGDYVSEAMYELGRTYIVSEQFGKGADMLKRFVADFPSSPHYVDALSDIGLAYQNMNNDSEAMRYYKLVVENSYRTPTAKSAMESIKSIYVDGDDVNGYFDYASRVGYETDVNVVERDSLSYAAAFRIYMNGDKARAQTALNKYLNDYPNGTKTAAALYYVADCAISDGRNGDAIEWLAKLTALSGNDYSERGAKQLADLCMNEKRYSEAATAYLRLSTFTQNSKTKQQALVRYLDAMVLTGDDKAVIEAADRVLAFGDVVAETSVKAKYAKATALSGRGETAQALTLYRELSDDVSTAEGAESAYRVIENIYALADRESAEKLIYAFAEKNTPHQYWLGRSFIILGDIYASAGDSFQARATYQSIIDGYSDTSDGVIDQAKERIKNLK